MVVGRRLKSGEWTPTRRDDLFGATLGIIGLGQIGKEIAKRALALGMRIIAYDPVQDETFAREHNVDYADFERVLSTADYVSLAMSLNDQTRGMINREALATMKSTAYLINVARGGLVVEEAVCEALAAEKLAGFATDVFSDIPLPEYHCLLQFDNVIVTPHVAAASKRTTYRLVERAAECAAKILTGQPAPEGSILNPEILPTWRGQTE